MPRMKKNEGVSVSGYVRGIIVGQAAAHDMELKELAALLGISQNTMTKYVHDPMVMTVGQLYQTLGLLGCKLNLDIETERPM